MHDKKILNLPVLGSFWGTALWIVLILHARSWFLSRDSAVQTMHETCSFLILHCQKSQSLCLTQSSPTLPIGQYYCWPCLHHVAFVEDSQTFAQADLKGKIYKLRLLPMSYSMESRMGRELVPLILVKRNKMLTLAKNIYWMFQLLYCCLLQQRQKCKCLIMCS